MISAHYHHIASTSCDHNLISATFGNPVSSVSYRQDFPNRTHVSSDPLLRDPFEAEYIESRSSGIPGRKI